MPHSSSLLVEMLWRLKRRVDKGDCPGMGFVHLNRLFRDVSYREDILLRAEQCGSDSVVALVAEIRAADPGVVLGAKPLPPAPHRPAAPPRPERSFLRRHLIWMLPGFSIVMAMTLGFTAFRHNQVVVHEDITTDTVWESGRTYILEDVVFVDGAKLTIPEGVTVKGRQGSALIVTRNSQLFVRGSRLKPVVFTSAKDVGLRARGDWGGLVLLGGAPVNQPVAQVEGLVDGSTRGRFGGEDERHSCGVIQFARIEFAGFEVYKNNELNGLTLAGCGRDTIIRNVQVHRPLDDGIEMFGGTVDLEKVVVTGPGDDGIDWDWGWRGRVQFALVQHYPDAGDNGFEGDNSGTDHNRLPRSEPEFFNVTLLGAGRSGQQHRAILLREGSGGHFHNMIIDGFGIEVFDTRDNVRSQVSTGQLTFSHNLVANSGGLAPGHHEVGDQDDDLGFDERAWIRTPAAANRFQLNSALSTRARDMASPWFNPVLSLREMETLSPPQSEFFDESARFWGAFHPEANESWIAGWTAFPLD